MSTTYKARAGDTYSSIARRFHGSEQSANLIFEANPSLLQPLVGGELVTIPVLPSFPRNQVPQRQSTDQDEVSILINNKRFRFWEVISIDRKIESIDTMSLGSMFEPSEPIFRNSFKPFSFDNIDVFVGNDLLFSGTLVRINPSVDSKSNTVSVTGYSTPGVLNDCTASSASFPLEFNNQGLQEIATKLASPFGVKIIFEADQGAVFEQVQMLASDTVFNFLIKLSKQRGLLINNNRNGDLVFSNPEKSQRVVASLDSDSGIVESVIPRFSEQDFYSEITGLAPNSIFDDGASFTLKNKQLTGVYRPYTFTARDTKDGNLKQAVEGAMGRMYANALSWTLNVTTWRDDRAKLWEPGTIIQLSAPRSMIYNPFEFQIKSVTLNKTTNSKTASLELVLPGSLENKIPESLPWDG